jgi:hypothetical protein
MGTRPEPIQAHGYEKSDASPRGLLYFALAMTAILAILSLSLIWLFKHYQKTQNPGAFIAAPFAGVEPVPPAPRIQPDPGADMRNYYQSQQNLLNSYAWIDRQNGIVRLPIDRAMELLLQRGLPTRSTNAPQNGAPKEEKSRPPNNAKPGGEVR